MQNPCDECEEEPLTEEDVQRITKNTCCAVLLPQTQYTTEELQSLSFPSPSLMMSPQFRLAAWAYRRQLWQNGSVLKVRFIGGTSKQKEMAVHYIKTVDDMCGLSFKIVKSGPAEVRIGFIQESGHWSYVGKDNLYIPNNQQTMNLGLTGNEGDKETRRVCIHETFHAIGLGHEHQHPRTIVDWNYRNVYAIYARTQGWSKAEIDYQVLRRPTAFGMVGTPTADNNSIMMYPRDRAMVNDPKFVVGWNSKESELDITTVASLYPF